MGIKSFQGAREIVKKEYTTPIMVEDYMTKKLVTFKPEQSILEVMELFTKYNISESRYFNMPILDKNVEKYMTKNVETIPHDISIFDAAGIFHKNNRRRLPVFKNGILVGQISRKDIVIAALKLSGQNWK
jgi:CBS domain-containing protein